MDAQASPAVARLYGVIVPVPDIEDAARFYGALFGQPGERVAVSRHYFDCGGVILACVVPMEGQSASAEFRPLPDLLLLRGRGPRGMLDRAREAGAGIEREIATYPWGERSFYVCDPFGNPLCFVDSATVFLGGRFVE
jgi:uncharacterized glyoxalase superfamily protein PhnB